MYLISAVAFLDLHSSKSDGGSNPWKNFSHEAAEPLRMFQWLEKWKFGTLREVCRVSKVRNFSHKGISLLENKTR